MWRGCGARESSRVMQVGHVVDVAVDVYVVIDVVVTVVVIDMMLVTAERLWCKRITWRHAGWSCCYCRECCCVFEVADDVFIVKRLWWQRGAPRLMQVCPAVIVVDVAEEDVGYLG